MENFSCIHCNDGSFSEGWTMEKAVEQETEDEIFILNKGADAVLQNANMTGASFLPLAYLQ